MSKENSNLRKRNNTDDLTSKTEAGSSNTPSYSYTASQNNDIHSWNSDKQYTTAAEYAEAVREWIYRYHFHKNMNSVFATFPFYSLACSAQPYSSAHPIPWLPSVNNNALNIRQGQNVSLNTVVPPPPQNRYTTTVSNNIAQPVRLGFSYRVPPLWKRVFAEFIDFIFLFLLKLSVMILAVEYVGGFDIERYDLDMIFSQDIDYEKAYALTYELIVMEILNRIVICIFEALCLRKGVGGIPGGTTPGKRMLGIKVVLCEEITDLENGWINIIPAADIGWWNAICRAVIKNFSLAFFFPVCFTVFFFQNNRAAYDIIANCIVIESNTMELVRLRNRANLRPN